MTRFRWPLLGGVLAMLSLVAGLALATPSAPGAKVFFVGLNDGDTVASPVTVHFGVSGMTIAPAGTEGPANSGHHHLLVDTAMTGDELKGPVPSDAQHLHFGKGQTETTLTLPPGKHTLQLVFADWQHVPHDPPLLSDKITITVK